MIKRIQKPQGRIQLQPGGFVVQSLYSESHGSYKSVQPVSIPRPGGEPIIVRRRDIILTAIKHLSDCFCTKIK